MSAGADPDEDAARAARAVVGLYDRRARDWITDRGRDLTPADRTWLGRFTAGLRPGDRVLDLGCGSGRPMAAALLDQGFAVTGVDAAAALVARARADLPAGRFVEGDMRSLDLDQTFEGLLAWHSLFHLAPEDQRLALGRLFAHAAPRAVLMFSSGPSEGHAIGDWRGEPLYHGSLDPEAYEALLSEAGFAVERGVWAEGGLVWLARRDG